VGEVVATVAEVEDHDKETTNENDSEQKVEDLDFYPVLQFQQTLLLPA
jgi:hypothetical protein